MKSEIYNLLSDFCFDKFVETGKTPTKDEMQIALNNFLQKFYEEEDEE